ncbi:MAG: DinB family protein [Cyclobacteriaceae bacterium]|nr:DinB family protein [Cyclobacteriaceae bacterium]
MQLKTTGQLILQQIADLIAQLNQHEFSAGLDMLNGNSIGKHIRHILEFFDMLTRSALSGTVNYDNREHEPLYETNSQAALDKLALLQQQLETNVFEKEIILEVSYSKTGADPMKIKSSIERELAYNIEHAIHHMAIIKIAVQTVFPSVCLPNDFGVAFSTIRFQKTLNAESDGN